ncbi:5-hydroxytryptamine receptor 1B-like [Saccostrea echinata]|uniref:5-hydroxytryptamine receptor 1B-like n=1 Tax=Saccostrea echinata TaxID=191078 RepID=UPI002A800E7E|nr:5-hydroxytryptamine receptor 1B-like [Saccostrea echinata]
MTNGTIQDGSGLYLYEDYHTYPNWTLFIRDIEKAHNVHSMPIAIFAIVLTCLSTLVNFCLCFVILLTRELRSQPLYACVLNFCFINLLMGLLVNSLVVYQEMSPFWKLGPIVCKTWIVLDVLLPFTSLMTLILMSIDRFVFARMHSLYKSVKFRLQREVYAILPWIFGIAIVLPVWIGGFKRSPIDVQDMCVFGLVDEASVASPILVFFLPALFLVLVMIFTNFFSFHQNSTEQSRTPSARSVSTRRTSGYYAYENNFSVVTLYLISVTFLILWAPFHMMNLLLAICIACMPPYSLIVGFTYMGATVSSVISFFWLTDYHIRYSLKHVICDRFRKQNNTQSNTVTLTLIEG